MRVRTSEFQGCLIRVFLRSRRPTPEILYWNSPVDFSLVPINHAGTPGAWPSCTTPSVFTTIYARAHGTLPHWRCSVSVLSTSFIAASISLVISVTVHLMHLGRIDISRYFGDSAFNASRRFTSPKVGTCQALGAILCPAEREGQSALNALSPKYKISPSEYDHENHCNRNYRVSFKGCSPALSPKYNGVWLLRWILQRTHLGTSDAAAGAVHHITEIPLAGKSCDPQVLSENIPVQRIVDHPLLRYWFRYSCWHPNVGIEVQEKSMPK